MKTSSRNSQIVKYLTTQQILAIHDQMIRRFGGSMGVRDIGLLESAADRPQATFDGVDLYKSLFDKAAALLHSLLKNHPFVDGNKRTALSSAGVFLRMNNSRLLNMHKKELEFALKVENESLSFEQIAEWLKTHTKKI
ncbi:MAG: type II toxin-antitoxin system death-on-curing family toxin [bacterium]|nr:type II toxin-antitoxin system death-on-curing family toxin [bacterium]